MTSTEYRLFHLNRILLITVGLWPYKQSNLIRLQLVLMFGILMSFIIFQLSRFLIVDCTFDFVVKILSTASLFMIFAIMYFSYWINMQVMRYLLDQLQCIYEQLKDENEIAILEKYSNNAKCFTAKLILITICSLFPIAFMICAPYIVDFIMPKNGTYARRFVEIVGKYYEIQEKYFYFITLHFNVAYCIGDIALLATGTMNITYFIQICGMFKISSYRIKRAMTINMLENICLKNENIMYKKIISAIDIHRKAMQFATIMISEFEKSYFVLIVITVCCLSLNLFQTCQMISLAPEIHEVLLFHLAVTISMLLFMYFPNYFGQEIINHDNLIYLTAYNIHWYEAPLHMQKLILFLLQRGTKSFTLAAGGLFTASLECFASLASTSMSYFTVMSSVHK